MGQLESIMEFGRETKIAEEALKVQLTRDHALYLDTRWNNLLLC